MNQEIRPSYRPDIDGMRAIAVLAVVIFHSFPSLMPGGFWGVDVFFVISGFLITEIILRQAALGTFSFSDFYGRRIRRIFPALLLVLGASLGAGWLLLFPNEYLQLGANAFLGAGFLANIGYWRDAASYFAPISTLKPLLHLWSLGIEEQFYLLWPGALILARKSGRSILPILATLFVLAFLLNFLPHLTEADLFYLPLSRFSEFLSGGILACLIIKSSQGKESSFSKAASRYGNFIALSGAGFLAYSFFFFGSGTAWRGAMIFPIAGAFLILAAGRNAWINRKLLASKLLVAIGLISYPLYLWHWPLLSFANIIIAKPLPIGLRMILVSAALILAWLTYEFIEKPIRKSTPGRFTSTLCILMLMTAIAGIAIYENGGFSGRLAKVQQPLLTTMQGAPRDSACEREFGKEFSESYCRISGSGSKRIYIIGDSISWGIFTGYADSLSKEGYKVILLGNSACGILFPEARLGRSILKYSDADAIKDCNKKMGNVIRIISADDPAGIIIANNAYSKGNRKAFEENMSELLSKLPAKAKILWFLKNPQPPFGIASCIDRPLSSRDLSENPDGICSFSRSISDASEAGYAEAVADIRKKDSRILGVIDPRDAFCDSDKCIVYRDGTFLYHDQVHLSLSGSEYLSSKLPISQYFPAVTH